MDGLRVGRKSIPMVDTPYLQRMFYFFKHQNNTYFPLAAVCVLAGWIAWPLVYTGWFADDLLQRAAYVYTDDALRVYPLEDRLTGPMRMYSFFDGHPSRIERALDLGGIPWWTNRSVHATFWRPLTALLSMADYRLWPDSSVWMHFHSLVWYWILLCIGFILYRTIAGPGWTAGSAVLLLAVNDILAVPVAFLANRHILIAAVFGLAAVWSHWQWRTYGGRRWAVWHVLFLLLSLLSSESGVCVFAYLLAYAIWIDRKKTASRWASLLPSLVTIVSWRAVYNYLGYGIENLDLYVDPGNDPAGFAAAVFERLPILSLSLFAFPPCDIYMVLTPFAIRVYWWFAVLMLALLGLLFYPFLKENRIARFWLTGTILAAVPLCAPFPGGRSLALASVGACGFLAQIVHLGIRGIMSAGWGSIRRNVAVITAAVLASIRLTTGTISLPHSGKAFDLMQQGIDMVSRIPVADADLIGRDVIFINPPCSLAITYAIPIRLIARRPVPERLRVLAPGLDPIELRRLDDRTLAVCPKYGYLSPPNWRTGSWNDPRGYVDPVSAFKVAERLLYDPEQLFLPGQTFKLTHVTIRIAQVTLDHRPLVADFTFDKPLEDPSYIFLRWNQSTWSYNPMPLPAIGERIVIE